MKQFYQIFVYSFHSWSNNRDNEGRVLMVQEGSDATGPLPTIHTEEEVASFLASQLGSQNVPQSTSISLDLYFSLGFFKLL